MMENDEVSSRHNRHEGHFKSIFKELSEIRNNYVRSPTFVVTLITIVLIISGASGWMLNKVFTDIDKNEKSVVELAIKQGRLEERQNNFINSQQQLITKLIDALKKGKGAN